MKTITVSVPDLYCAGVNNEQCNFVYPTGKNFRCRYFDLRGGFLHRDKEYRIHKCEQCTTLSFPK